MKFVSFLSEGKEFAGLIHEDRIFPLADAGRVIGFHLPDTMGELLEDWATALTASTEILKGFSEGIPMPSLPYQEAVLLAPVPRPTSCRDGYAFRQHVATARRNRGVEMIPEFDQYPVFYFTNHHAIDGPGNLTVEADHLKQLDFELELAVVIGKGGKNIPSAEADSYIAGFTIMNDMSARTLQMEEMKLNLGPAKGKDFSTVLGPWLVTPDELEQYKITTPFGNSYNLEMKAYHNGKQISYGNAKDMNWTFAELIERAAYGVNLHAGDVIGSGTVGTGCYLELNGTAALLAKEKGETYTPVWLQPGDTITLEITGLGTLTNTILDAGTGYSILAKKK